MENENTPKEFELTTEKVVMFIIEVVLIISGLATLYSLIWANWPAFQLSATIFVTMIIGIIFGYWMVDMMERLTKK